MFENYKNKRNIAVALIISGIMLISVTGAVSNPFQPKTDVISMLIYLLVLFPFLYIGFLYTFVSKSLKKTTLIFIVVEVVLVGSGFLGGEGGHPPLPLGFLTWPIALVLIVIMGQYKFIVSERFATPRKKLHYSIYFWTMLIIAIILFVKF